MLWKVPVSIVLMMVVLFIISNVSPIYDFKETVPFSGDAIYNPYSALDTSLGWSRTNLHTHTHAAKWINECEFYPDSVLAFYEKYGYDVVTFSNHMELTGYPGDFDREVRVYEHGWNLAKHHNLVFNPVKVHYWDMSLPLFCSQKQYKIDRLGKDADFVFFNHPDRTNFTDDGDMAQLTGYRLTEAVCGFGYDDTRCHKWDVALSTGHYVPSAISDDLHKPRRSDKIARRCSFLNISRPHYDDIREALLAGRFYSMYLPDFGNGDLSVKEAANHNLAEITDIGVRGGTVYMKLSRPAVCIETIGQGGEILKTLNDTSVTDFTFRPGDTYIRMTARFADSTVIFTNPFARWKGTSVSGTPYVEYEHKVNLPLTFLFNLALVLMAAGVVFLIRKCFSSGHKPDCRC
ncbi:MAG: hypothetical protein KBS57_00650 [Alistipes sp.]|nr:hypothetical protein [Candidatus Minthomonas equi]